MQTKERKLDSNGRGPVSAVFTLPDGPNAATAVILAHGAGNDMRNPLLVAVDEGLARRGYATVRFNFPYKEKGGKAPDPGPVLEACYRSVVEQVRSELAPTRLVLGGKSMGGRIASQIVAAGVEADGLLFLGYPLHPAGRPEKLRVAHLAKIRVPMLFLAGTRDPLCDLDLLRQSIAGLSATVTLHIVEDGDHSFRVRKRSGRIEQQVLEELIAASCAWLAGIERPAG